jgi:hypothetical protein
VSADGGDGGSSSSGGVVADAQISVSAVARCITEAFSQLGASKAALDASFSFLAGVLCVTPPQQKQQQTETAAAAAAMSSSGEHKTQHSPSATGCSEGVAVLCYQSLHGLVQTQLKAESLDLQFDDIVAVCAASQLSIDERTASLLSLLKLPRSLEASLRAVVALSDDVPQFWSSENNSKNDATVSFATVVQCFLCGARAELKRLHGMCFAIYQANFASAAASGGDGGSGGARKRVSFALFAAVLRRNAWCALADQLLLRMFREIPALELARNAQVLE